MIDRRFLDVGFFILGKATKTLRYLQYGDQYIIDGTGTDEFKNAEKDQIARYDEFSRKWEFSKPTGNSLELMNLETGEILYYSSETGWETKTKFLLNYTINGIVNAPQDKPYEGMQYIVGNNPAGDFEDDAESGQIARYANERWSFITPKIGDELINIETNELLKYTNDYKWVSVLKFNGGDSNDSGGNIIFVDAFAKDSSAVFEDIPGTFGLNNGIANYRNFYTVKTAPIGTKLLFENDGNFYLLEVIRTDGSVCEPEYQNDEFAYNVTEGNIGKKLSVGTLVYNKLERVIYEVHQYVSGSGNFAKNILCLERLTLPRTFVVEELLDWAGMDYQWDDNTKLHDGYKRYVVSDDEEFWYSGVRSSTYNAGQNDWTYDDYYSYGGKYLAARATGYANEMFLIYFPANNLIAKSYPTFLGESDLDRHRYAVSIKLFKDDIIINKADGVTYQYDGKQFIALTKAKLPSAVTATGSTLPTTATAGDTFINVDNFKLYAATAKDTWNSGIEIPKGYTFLNEADGQMYFFNGTEIKGVVSE